VLDSLNIAASDLVPKVSFDMDQDFFEISKRSLPENSLEFYQPIISWLHEYSLSPKPVSNFVFHFEFISTSSVKQVMKLMFVIEEISKKNKVHVLWNYDKGDKHMQRTGELLEKLVKLKFQFSEQ
jgi:hypothetical protein